MTPTEMQLGQVASGNTAILFGDDAAPMLDIARQLEGLRFRVEQVIDGLDLIECRLSRDGILYSLSWDIWTGLVLFPYESTGNAVMPAVLEHLRAQGW